MVDGRTPYWKSFLTISQRHIGQFMQISELRWRITCRYRSLDQNDNFRKFKMADGLHFENSFLSISQSELSDFDQIWYADANYFHSEDGYLTKIEIFPIQDGGRTPYWKSFFGYFGALIKIGRSTRNSERRWRITCQYSSRDQNCNFPNSWWRTAAILKTVFGVDVILVMN